MNGSILKIIALTGIACINISNNAFADEKNLYIKFGTGIGLPNKKNSIADNAIKVRQKLSNGTILYGGIGYKLSNNVRFDLDLTNYSNLKRSFHGSSGTAKQKLTANTLLFNMYYDFVNNSSFSPYMGVGLGMTQFKTKFLATNSSSQGTYTVFTPVKKKSNSLAFKIGLGVNYTINKYISIDAGYSFVNLGKVSSFAQGTTYVPNFAGNSFIIPNIAKSKTIYAHNFNIGMRIPF